MEGRPALVTPSDAMLDLLWQAVGDPAQRREEAWNQLFDAAYVELHRIASCMLRSGGRAVTLTPTVLVNETYLRLAGAREISWESRAHFFGIAARAMRQFLAAHSRERLALKRGGHCQQTTLNTNIGSNETPIDGIALEQAFQKLEREHERMARVCELKVFTGLTMGEISAELGIPLRTAERDWALGRKWLSRELGDQQPSN